ncbi:COX6A-domain-containing protein [Suhomyces tanzawaensis NRRL Y-17324]|uniref:Cytochrome c oxidase subunit n=1 Tax=Suhomyces tanzawaensis NRRL Y-17324 TaxID=984487 RepID=A0A1E4SCQ4_9ASCO|nr:COX6A-domain-containing protein [Suhomyces tanzawaensis NRRL Y-17324]ODV77275.1 COX6A-domain-containing protein [Suhomyces tanzawaensis NRRL Y-17324]
MFKRAQQVTFRRLNHHAYGPSKHLNEHAFSAGKINKEAGEAFKKNLEEKVHHSEGITNTWKRLTYLIAFPAIVLTAIPVVNIEMKHAKHREHLKHLSDEEWPTQYDYQNLRQKPFFWGDGDKTLFWNPDVNRHVEA